MGDEGKVLEASAIRVLHTESSTALGGQEFRILSEAIGMRDRGHFVVLAVPPGSQIEARANQLGLLVESVNMNRVRWGWLIWVFLKIISKHRVNVVSTHGSIDSWTASIAGRISKQRPIVVRTRHKSTPISNTIRHQWLYKKLPNVVVTTGEVVRHNVMDQIGLAEHRVVSIPTGVDLQKFKVNSQYFSRKNKIGKNQDEPIVGTISFFRKYKGLSYFLKAAKLVKTRVPATKFVIVGDGPDRGLLEQQIHELGLNDHIVMTGFREDVAELLSEMDVFVLASIEGEGLPQALTQAMAMGKAVVATNVGSVPEVVENQKTGLLVSPRNEETLAEAISSLVHNYELRVELGAEARRRIEQSYSVETMLLKTETMYQDLLNNESLHQNPPA